MSGGRLSVKFSTVVEPVVLEYLHADGVKVLATDADRAKFDHVYRAFKLGLEPEGPGPRFSREVKERQIEMIEKRIPGDVAQIVKGPVSDADRKEYAAEYLAWKSGKTVGTPLATLTPTEMEALDLSPEIVKVLEAGNCTTVEHVEELSDGNVRSLMGGLRLRQLAREFMAKKRALVIPAPVEAALAAVAARIDALEARVSRLEGKHQKESTYDA